MKFMSFDHNHIVETTHVQVKEMPNIIQPDGSTRTMFCVVDRDHVDSAYPVVLTELVHTRQEAQEQLASLMNTCRRAKKCEPEGMGHVVI